ncbi:hypothetical protein Q7A53_05795 [Halobacillus rhizosphaerae]|uniref:hypothetical protein n=1 Tax=Halobacillus rhizosphaerae TaxID=3064889 RepID=UPI00398B43A6
MYQDTMNFRMVQMQIMNIVNVGLSKGVSSYDIELLTDASINATQMFLSEHEIKTLRQQLHARLQRQELLV